MKSYQFSILCFLLIFCGLAIGGSSKRIRFRGKKTKVNCHLKEMDKCLSKLERYQNQTNSYELIKSSRGLDEICSNAQEVFECSSEYLANCGTPLQKEMFDFATEYFTKSIDQFCRPGEMREEFLKFSPCVADNVLAKADFKLQCNKPYFDALNKIGDHQQFDARVESTCCSFNRWKNCVLNMTENACEISARKSMENFFDKAFAGLANIFCNQEEFDPSSSTCSAILSINDMASVSTEKSMGKNQFSRYLSTYFSFLFTD